MCLATKRMLTKALIALLLAATVDRMESFTTMFQARSADERPHAISSASSADVSLPRLARSRSLVQRISQADIVLPFSCPTFLVIDPTSYIILSTIGLGGDLRWDRGKPGMDEQTTVQGELTRLLDALQSHEDSVERNLADNRNSVIGVFPSGRYHPFEISVLALPVHSPGSLQSWRAFLP